VVYIFGSQISNLAKPAFDWSNKSAGSIYLQNTRDELQNIEFN